VGGEAWALGRIGKKRQPVLQHWDGAAWSLADLPATKLPFIPSRIGGTSPNDVWLLGGKGRRIYPPKLTSFRWDGNSWTRVPVSLPIEDLWRINDVAPVGPGDVWAVGLHEDEGSAQPVPLSIHWDGASWSLIPVFQPTEYGGELLAIDGEGSALWAVGEIFVYGFGWAGSAVYNYNDDYDGWASVPVPEGYRLLDVGGTSINRNWVISESAVFRYSSGYDFVGYEVAALPRQDLNPRLSSVDGVGNYVFIVGGANRRRPYIAQAC
jgi:hypothetical protein